MRKTAIQAKRERYNEQRVNVCKRLNITKKDYNYLRLQGERLRALYVLNCNGYLSENDYDKRTTKLENFATKRAESLGLHIFFQTDPRGATVYVDFDPLPDNTYTLGTCIY